MRHARLGYPRRRGSSGPRGGNAPAGRARPPRRPRLETIILVVGFAAAVMSGVAAYRAGGPYGDRNEQDPRVRRVYDPATGKLTMVVYDANGNLRLDHWCYMDGERLLRMDVDEDEDGAIDRREHYGPGERLEQTEYLDHGKVTRTETPGGGQGMEPRK